VTHYVVVEIGVIGTDCFGQIVKRTFKTQALVVPRLDVDFFLGSNVADRHNIVVIPDERTTTMFRGEDKITIKCIKWSEVQRHMIERQKKTNTSVSAVGVNSMEETPEHKMLKNLERRVEESGYKNLNWKLRVTGLKKSWMKCSKTHDCLQEWTPSSWKIDTISRL
jgi:hypothetical protein